VGRYGGDEFVILLPQADRVGVTMVAQRILDTMAERGITVPGQGSVPLALSIGCALFPEDGMLPHDLLGHADAALYDMKRRGGNGLHFVQKAHDDSRATADTSTTFSALQGLVNAVDAKDRYTREHSDVVTVGALLLAGQLGLSADTCSALHIAGLLHDVGKIGIPDRILRKPGPLTAEEYAIMQQHVSLSELIIKDVPHLEDVLQAVSAHHERYDGQGYPRGLRGEEIPLVGRIMALADACSAMLVSRPYRKGLSWAQVMTELRRGSGTQFDAALVEPFIAAVEQSALVAEAMAAHHREHKGRRLGR
jgi:HD-GYP domain-containing protein (c-di-GMP phosphodiesterase class II)